MTSSEDVIIEALKSEISGLKVYVDGRLLQTESKLSELRAEVRAVDEKVEMLNIRVQGMADRIEDIKFYVSLTFGALAVIVTFAALLPSLVKYLNTFRRIEAEPESVRRIVEEILMKRMSSKE